MRFFTPYKTPKFTLDDSRNTTVNDVLRTLEGTTPTHVLLKGKEGSGRHTITNALAKLARSINRSSVLKLDVGALSTALYESADTSELFEALRQATKSYRRALVVIESPDLLADGVERHEARRLVRFLTELLHPHDLRAVVLATEDQAVQLLGLSPGMKKLFTTHTVQPLAKEVTVTLLGQLLDKPHAREHLGGGQAIHLRGERERADRHLAKSLVELSSRYYPHRGLPGGAFQLLADAEDRAEQAREALTIEHIYATIAAQRNLPLSALSSSDMSQLQNLQAALTKRIVGQDHAVETVTRVIQRAHVGLASTNRPIASFLFLGPSGVGKTELAKSLAQLLYHSDRSFIRIDMSEFSEGHTVQRLIGAPPGYVGYEEGGQLTNPVDQEPYSLVLLDEIEKAHPKVFDTFLQLLDDGRLTDGRGKTVDFRHTIVVATSNIGLHEIVAAAETGALGDRDTFLRKTLLPLLVENFRPEFLNRFDAIVAFRPLPPEELVKIGQAQLEILTRKLSEQHITLTVSPQRLASFAKRAYQPTFGARPMRRLIQDEIETPIAQQIVAGTLKPGTSITL